MKIKNFKIGWRLGAGFGIVVIITALVGILALFQMQALAEFTTKMYRHPLAVSNAVNNIRANINGIHRSIRDVVLADNVDEIEENVAYIDIDEQQVYDDFEIVFERFLGDMTDVEHAYQEFSDWKIIRDEVIELSVQGKKSEAAEITKGKGADHVRHMTTEIQEMIDFASNKADSFFEDAQARTTQEQKSVQDRGGTVATGRAIACGSGTHWSERLRALAKRQQGVLHPHGRPRICRRAPEPGTSP